MIFDIFTLFANNAAVSAVTTCAFVAAWLRQRHVPYWPTSIAASLAIGLSPVAFMAAFTPLGSVAAPVATVLLVVGFGLRWRAARQFTSRPAPWIVPVVIPGLGVALFFALPMVVPYRSAFGVANGVVALQAIACLWAYWRDRDDGLTSRYGLVAVDGMVAALFGLRALHGVVFGDDMVRFVPQDVLFGVQLLAGVIHTVSAGGFALSLAYERNATQLRRIALCDDLTGLGNRRAFQKELMRATPLGSDQGCAVALFDIDHFKQINDRHGHAVGDEALRRCAAVIRAAVRRSDTVARIGGEEFAALLKDITLPEAREVLERVRHAVEASEIDLGGGPIRLTISAGLYYAPQGPLDYDWAMRKADASLYKAKRTGRNRVELAA